MVLSHSGSNELDQLSGLGPAVDPKALSTWVRLSIFQCIDSIQKTFLRLAEVAQTGVIRT